ncbi:MAG TPA: HD domain-containing phosphohydrolase [Pyrinomonadaceae bacterium]|nr:HD domain-containing phosphohydrolase [Pyrinomonadaceae bacterium]
MTHKLLIVDDEVANLRLLQRLFSPAFTCLTASSGMEAIRLIERHDIAIIITDQRMPMMTGLELLKRTAALRPHMVRILLTGYTDVEALVEALNSGLVYMYISKPWNNDDLKLRVNRACEHYLKNKKSQALADANKRLTQRLDEIKLSVVAALSELIRVGDAPSYDHALRVRNCAMLLADKMGLREEQKQDLGIAALLHDINPIDAFTKSTAANRESPLSARAEARLEIEMTLLNAIPELASVAEIISCNGENYDGTGFPRGLLGDQIPIAGRILRLADEYDLMVLPKASAPMTHSEVMRFLTQRAGKQFDPEILEVLSQLAPNDINAHHQMNVQIGDVAEVQQDIEVDYPGERLPGTESAIQIVDEAAAV